jgi:DtxR family Mn-dependent transcriptional regulator
MIVRKHRLWSNFLDKLRFSWDEVHDIAVVRHIKSEKLINKLDDFLGNPTEDHMAWRPDTKFKKEIVKIDKQLLSELVNQKGFVWN